MRRLVLLALTAALCRALHAQEPPCGLRTVTETAAPVYPAIARAAHVSGPVVLTATFDTAGKVTQVTAVSGPPLLRDASVAFVKGWQANPYTGPRTCPVVVEYRTTGEPYQCGTTPPPSAPPPPAGRLDPQHFRVLAVAGCYNVAVRLPRRNRPLNCRHRPRLVPEWGSLACP